MSNYFDSAASTWDSNPMKVQRAQATAEMVRATPINSRKSLIDFGGGTGLLSICLKDDFETITIVLRVIEYFKVPKIGQGGLEKEYPLFFLAAHKI